MGKTYRKPYVKMTKKNFKQSVQKVIDKNLEKKQLAYSGELNTVPNDSTAIHMVLNATEEGTKQYNRIGNQTHTTGTYIRYLLQWNANSISNYAKRVRVVIYNNKKNTNTVLNITSIAMVIDQDSHNVYYDKWFLINQNDDQKTQTFSASYTKGGKFRGKLQQYDDWSAGALVKGGIHLCFYSDQSAATDQPKVTFQARTYFTDA